MGAPRQPGRGREGHQAVREGAGAEEPVCREGPGTAEQEETDPGGARSGNHLFRLFVVLASAYS